MPFICGVGYFHIINKVLLVPCNSFFILVFHVPEHDRNEIRYDKARFKSHIIIFKIGGIDVISFWR